MIFLKIYVHWKVNPRRFDYFYSPYWALFRGFFCDITEVRNSLFLSLLEQSLWYSELVIRWMVLDLCFTFSISRKRYYPVSRGFFLVWLLAFAKSFAWRVSRVQLVATRMTSQMLKAMYIPERNLCTQGKKIPECAQIKQPSSQHSLIIKETEKRKSSQVSRIFDNYLICLNGRSRPSMPVLAMFFGDTARENYYHQLICHPP